MDPIRIFVGSDRYQRDHGAELVLAHSIRKHCSRPVEIHFMRSGDPGFEVSEHGDPGTWKVGKATDAGWVKHPGSWGTPFSGFRFAIPELCGFKGRAIYLDADMLLLADIAELWDLAPATDRGIRCITWNRTDVSVIDCGWFAQHKRWWPKIDHMKRSGAQCGHYVRLLNANRAIDPTLPGWWNDCDGALYRTHPKEVKLVHYTNVLIGQPYRPYPNVDYPKHYPYCETNPDIGVLWWDCYLEALTDKHGREKAVQMVKEASA